MNPIGSRQYDPDKFTDDLLRWHEQSNSRSLPWTGTKDPYKIWVSEIMLQQTQAGTVKPYYRKFIAAFPSVAQLASAPLDDVLSAWAGLGYYSRARNLHKTAQLIRADHDGVFPSSAKELMELPGIGRSTAGAICALAFDLNEPILDGNAKRVYSRVYEIGDASETVRVKRLWSIAATHTSKKRSAEYTQAIMDLGATICLPRKPKCDDCPLSSRCGARKADLQESYPVRKAAKKSARKSVTMVMVMDDRGRVLLERRPAVGIWGGLWSFPEHDDSKGDLVEWLRQNYAVEVDLESSWSKFTHQFTHLQLEVTPQPCKAVRIYEDFSDLSSVKFLEFSDALRAGTPAPVNHLLNELQSRFLKPC